MTYKVLYQNVSTHPSSILVYLFMIKKQYKACQIFFIISLFIKYELNVNCLSIYYLFIYLLNSFICKLLIFLVELIKSSLLLKLLIGLIHLQIW